MDNQEAEEFLRRGIAAYQQGDYETAVSLLQQATELNPQSFQAWEKYGAVLQQLGRYTEAIEANKQALRISGRNQNIFDLEESVNSDLSNTANTVDLSQYLPNQTIVNSETEYDSQAVELLNQGFEKYQAGDYLAAIKLWTQAIKIKPDDYSVYNARGSVLCDYLGRYEEAITDFTQVIKIKPDYYSAYYNRGSALSNLGRYEEAITDYTKAIEIKPDFYLAYNSRGNVLDDLGRYEEAITDYTKAIEIKPDFYLAYNNRGNVLDDLGRYEEAITNYTKAIKIKPDFYLAHNGCGNALSNLGRYEEAITDYTKAIKIKPDFYLAWANWGSAISQSRGYEAAITNWDKGLSKLNPKDKEYQLGCGTLHWFKGDAHYQQARNHYQYPLYQEALKSYYQAIKFLKDNPRNRETYLEVLKGLIKTYHAIGNKEKVKAYEDIAVNLFEKLLNEASPSYKIVLLRKFSGFFQLRVDRLARSQDLTQQKEALKLAEERKNISLAWLQGENTSSPNYEEMQKIWLQLPPQTAIIYWHLSPISLTTFLLTENNFQTFTTDLSPTLSQIELRKVDKKDNLEKWLTNWKETYSSYSKAEDSNAWRETLPQQLEKLAYFLSIPTLQEKLQTLQVENLILIPHRDLHLLPLHALFQLNSENPPTSFSYLPSIKQGLNKENNQANELTNLLSVESSEGKTSLLFTAVEAAVIASFYDNCTTVKAKEDVMGALENPGDFLFTGHGYHNFTQPEKSALILGDEQLTVEEIFKSKISPRHLVTLSACETGLTGDKELIDEFVSLGSAFLAKGASYIITSLWRVDERATAILLMRFHQLIKDRVATVTAFNQAVNWLRDLDQGSLANWYSQLAAELLNFPHKRKYGRFLQREANILRNKDDLTFRPYTHPYYWAGFTITGVEPREKQKSGRLG